LYLSPHPHNLDKISNPRFLVYGAEAQKYFTPSLEEEEEEEEEERGGGRGGKGR
jgi:hypothetical protein